MAGCQSACRQLEAALDYVREGDTFAVTKLDRLARSVGDLLAIVARLEVRGFPSGFCRSPATSRSTHPRALAD
jgi:DNA invertase Pin-like site-specific DNA recombinase